MTSIAALSRRLDDGPRAHSVRGGGWHRLSMLATLAVLTVFPWTTTTGCEGKSAPTHWTGVDLLSHALRDSPVGVLAPLGLFLVAALAFLAARWHAKRRLVVQIAAVVIAAPSVFFTFVLFALPTAGDVEEHHAPFALGVALLLAFFLDAVVRLVLGVREWWLARSDHFERSAISLPV
ncbi:MAG TPA: hypothetical protein VGO62_15460 [Myxococcota bacterium]